MGLILVNLAEKEAGMSDQLKEEMVSILESIMDTSFENKDEICSS